MATDLSGITKSIVKSTEIGGSSLVMGIVEGRYGQLGGTYEVGGVPIDLAVGLGLHALAAFVLPPTYKSHAHNVADGALARFSGRHGTKVGTESR